MSPAPTETPAVRPWYQRIGPGLITACVVIGPGSILTSSNVGVRNGYALSWVVVVAVIFMLAFMSMGARLGVSTDRSTGTLLAERVGRWFAVLIGVSVFFISSAFQFGNNLGVHFALKTYADFPYWIVLFNALAIGFLLFSKNLYKALEKLMMFFVGIMLVAFAVNLIVAGPRFGEWFAGFVPGGVKVNLTVLGLVGTTFVTTAALYQSYLVRQKGWSETELKDGMIDVRVGAAIMALITLMLMATPATVFHQDFVRESIIEKPGDSSEAKATLIIDDSDPEEFARLKQRAEKEQNWETDSPRWTTIYAQSEYDALGDDVKQLTKPREFQGLPEVGRSLEPLFGAIGPMLFFLGVFSAAYSSFLVNSMIGGFILADGLGMGSSPEDRWPRIFTIIVLLTGMGVGLYCILVLNEQSPVELIVAAQAVTVVASPLVAGSLLWLTSKREVMGKNVNGPVLTGLGVVGLILLLAMSANTLMNVLKKLGWM
jgi:Mn2+/Fe2+ NRAMP family transporter